MDLPKFVKKPPAKGKAERPKPAKGGATPKKKPAPPKEPVDDFSACPVCGSKVSVTDTRCGSCGVEFEPEGEVPLARPTLPPEPRAKGGFVVMDTEMADCPVCSTAVTFDAARCPKCGTEFEAEGPDGEPIPPVQDTAAEDDEQAECPICGTPSSVTNKSCPFCGAEFEPVGATPIAVVMPSTTPLPLAKDVGEGVSCPVCGEIVGTSIETCPRCGAGFEPEVVAEAPLSAAPEIAPSASEEEVLCPVCGRSVGASVAACPYCGVEFEEEEGPEVQASMFAFKPPKGILRPPPSRAGDSRRGMSNGESAINGVSLVNGVGQMTPPSRVNGLGTTNGMDLVNGRGRSNGSAVNGRRPGSRGQHRLTIRRWQLMAIIIACAIIVPAVYFATIGVDEGPFSVDGQFDDWADEARLTTVISASSPSIDVVEWSVATYSDTLYLYIETESPMMAGETVEGVALLIDTDGSEETGYALAEFGADAMIEIRGWNGSLSVLLCSSFGSSDDRLDWNAWIPRSGVTCSVDGSRLEASTDMLASLTGTSRVFLASMDEYGPGSRSYPFPIEGGLLVIEQTPSADIVSDGILGPGTDVIVSTLRFSCLGAGGVVDAVSPEVIGVELLESVGPFSLNSGEEFTVDLRADTSSALPGQFVSVVVSLDYVESSFAEVYVVGEGAKAYAGAPPGSVVVDGAFADWMGRTVLDSDANPVENANIDIDEVAGANDTDRSYFFVSVYGEVFAGAYVPESCSKPTAAENSTVVQTRRSGEDLVSIYVDTDRSSVTGFRVSVGLVTIGAEGLIEVSGLCGEVTQTNLSTYVDGGWTSAAASVDVEIDESRMELGLDSDDIGVSGEFDFLVITTDWRKNEDFALFNTENEIDIRSYDDSGITAPYPGPVTESMPEFGDMAVPVIILVIASLVLVRRKRESKAISISSRSESGTLGAEGISEPESDHRTTQSEKNWGGE